MIRFLTSSALLLTALAAPVAVQAQTQAQDAGQDMGRWSFAAGASTDNRSKDASKSDGDPSIWGTAEWESGSGLFYVSPEFETIKSNGSNVELTLSAGMRPQWGGFDIDLNAAHKWRVDSNPGADDDAWEFTANVSRSIGPAKARMQLQHSPDGAGSVKDWTWVEGRLGWDFTDKLSGSAAVGYRFQTDAPDYTGWNVGVTYAATRNIDLDLRYHDTDADDNDPGRQYASAVVAGVSFYY